ncbi:CDP-alcohol phosphatidyltransferase family protein, partial [Candidatus Poribacteria bacterium]
MTTSKLREIERKLVTPLALRIAPYVSGNLLSFCSLLAALGAGTAFWRKMPLLGAALIVLNGLLDLLDGG